jgi:hypothetical protein
MEVAEPGEVVEAPVVPVCRHWQRMGWCLYAERCRFRHPEQAVAAVAEAGSGSATATSTSSSLAEDRRLAFTKYLHQPCYFIIVIISFNFFFIYLLTRPAAAS